MAATAIARSDGPRGSFVVNALLSAQVSPRPSGHAGARGVRRSAKVGPGGRGAMAAVARHFRFVREHHRQIEKVGVVTKSPMGTIAEQLASHFVAATIKRFPVSELAEAKAWVIGTRD
jgi:hypothetical protein